MPKKNPQHTKKVNHRSGIETDKSLFPNEDPESKSVTKIPTSHEVSQEPEKTSEQDKKYGKREIHSNWTKYDVELINEDDKSPSEPPKATDFNFLLSISSTDCSYFQYRSYKLDWEKEKCKPNHNIFNLDLQVLSSGLATIPFYERIGVDKSTFSDDIIKKCDLTAVNNAVKYQLIKENFKKSQSVNLPESLIADLQGSTITALDKPKPDEMLVSTVVKETQKPESDKLFNWTKLEDSDVFLGNKIVEVAQVPSGENIKTKPVCELLKPAETPADVLTTKSKPKINKLPVTVNSLDKEENLDDWLDSVLDD